MKRKIFTHFLLTALAVLSFTMGASAQCSITSVAGNLSFTGYSFSTCSTITVTGYINDTDWGTIKTFLVAEGANFTPDKTLNLDAAIYTGAATGTTGVNTTYSTTAPLANAAAKFTSVLNTGAYSLSKTGTVIIPGNINIFTGGIAYDTRVNIIGYGVTQLGQSLNYYGINDANYTLDLAKMFPNMAYVASSYALMNSTTIKSIIFPASCYINYSVTPTAIDRMNGTTGDNITPVTSITILYTGAPLATGNYSAKSLLDLFQASTNTSTTVYVPAAQLAAYQALYPTGTGNTYSKIVFAPAYSVTYNANTGSGTVPTQHDAGATTTIKVAAGSNLSKTGYTFKEWNTAADGSGTAKAAGSSYTIPSAPTTFYAQWTANKYSVTYNVNGGTGTAPTQADADYNSSITVAAGTGLTKEGYTFAGWNTAADGSGSTYAENSSYTIPAAATTLYAQWTINKYSVTYNVNGGTGTAPTQADADYNSTITVAAGTGLTKAGYNFTGWNTAADGSGSTYAANSSYTIPAAATTLYAQWQIATFNPEVSAENLKVSVVNSRIYVDGVNNYEVYTVAGQKIDAKQPLQQGIYIVKSGDKMAKVFVNK